jgi:hypothetical protein
MISIKEYIVHASTWKLGKFTILDVDSPAFYTCRSPLSFTPATIELREGASGPVVCAAHVPWFSRTIRVAFEDPTNVTAAWGNMRSSSLFKANAYEFSWTLPTGIKHEFEWKGTHNVEGFIRKFDDRHIKLMHTETDTIAARLICEPTSFAHFGVIEIWQDFGGEKWYHMVILSALSIQLQLMRRDLLK